MIFIDSIEDAKIWLRGGATEPATLQSVDLTALDAEFAKVSVAGSAFMGCGIGPVLYAKIGAENAALVTELPALPSKLPAFAPGIYTVADLYDGMEDDGSKWDPVPGQNGQPGWDGTPDWQGFDFFNKKKNVPRTLTPVQVMAARMHDTVQEQALLKYLQGKKVVAIMGGHDFRREQSSADVEAAKQDVYWECVEIAKRLTEAGFLILTGGGPGVMEAGNLGALLAGEDAKVVAAVKAMLTHQDFESKEWRSTAMAVRAKILGSWTDDPPASKFSLGIPTWLYGHEPPNLFAGYHAKMFFNSLREDGLVTLANKGIIFFEGNGGTVQEIFQDATQNYYLGEGQSPTPMVFYNAGGYWDRPCGDQYWPTDVPVDKRKPLMPLMKQLATEKKFQTSVFVTRSPKVP